MLHNPENVFTDGVDINQAEKVVIAIHGRGASAQSILSLSTYFELPNLHWIAPQATNNTWYPYSFMESREKNEPWLSSALELLDAILDKVKASGFEDNQIVFLGFSQGACLASEYVARRARKFGGLIAFSGGLIGPEIDKSLYSGNFDGMPAFIGCSDHDFHIPESRVHDSANLLTSLGANVEAIIYPNMGHTIIEDEILKAAKILG